MTLIGGKYRLLKQIGEGAMGVVSSAVNTATGGQVAIKLILRSEPELRQRLIREAQACGAIRHKNVVQVYDVGTTDSGDPFLVMELLQGETLAALLARKRRLPPHEACAIARDVARALAAAHAVPIVHRDLKPANIFLHTEPGEDEPVVKVVDFGVSKNLQASDGLRTVAGGAVGSPMYMSPEQARADRSLDHRADLWSLGVVLYEMLTGERPFSGDAVEVVHKILSDPIPRVARRLRKLDPDIDRIVAGCLTRDPAQRLGPASEIAKQLEQHTLGAMREPLPSLMDTGAHDSSPLSAAGSGGGALSPGHGRTSLGAASPGVGSTDLRPPSGGAPLSLSAAASVAAEMHRSGPWDASADDDGATIPIEPKVLQARLSGAAVQSASGAPSSKGGWGAPPPPPESGWGPGAGGTIPIHAYPASGPAPRTAPPPPAPARPHDTVRMDQSVGAALVAHGAPTEAAPVVAVPASPPTKPRRDKVVLGAIAVIIVSSLAAVAIWVLTPLGGRAEPAPPVTVANTARQPAPTTGQSALPSTDPQPTATPTAQAAPSVEPTTAASLPEPAPSKPAVTTAATVVPVVPPKPTTTVTQKPAGATGAKTTTKPPCKSKFGVGCK